MSHGLERFQHAQDEFGGGHAAFLREIRGGSKTGHWIWYVFPQLAGLGRSGPARTYALQGVAEAEDYLRDPLLRARLLEITTAVREQLEAGARVRTLMGSEIDALKLVSSMTLFEAVARRLAGQEPDAAGELAALARECAAVLATAGKQALPRCAITVARLAEEGLATTGS